MTPDELRSLFAYDTWANHRTLEACANLAPEQFARDLGSSFGSVRDTLVHILGAQSIWLERLHGRAPSGLPAPHGYADLAAVRARWDEVERGLVGYVNGLSADEANRVLDYKNFQGKPLRNPIWQILQHLANHGTYHRGQVTTLLRQLGAKAVSTDLIAFYREQASPQAG